MLCDDLIQKMMQFNSTYGGIKFLLKKKRSNIVSKMKINDSEYQNFLLQTKHKLWNKPENAKLMIDFFYNVFCKESKITNTKYILFLLHSNYKNDNFLGKNNDITRNVIHCICKGKLKIVKFFCEIIKIDKKFFSYNAAEYACADGYFYVTKYLHSKFGLSREYFIKCCEFSHSIMDYHALDSACKRDNLRMIQYLYENIGATKHEFKQLSCPLTGENLEVIKYFFENMKFTIYDFKNNYISAFIGACRKGNLDVIKYLHRFVGVTKKMATRNFGYGTYEACISCEHSTIDLVRYLHERMQYDKKKIIFCCQQYFNYNLQRTCVPKHNKDVVIYLNS